MLCHTRATPGPGNDAIFWSRHLSCILKEEEETVRWQEHRRCRGLSEQKWGSQSTMGAWRAALLGAVKLPAEQGSGWGANREGQRAGKQEAAKPSPGYSTTVQATPHCLSDTSKAQRFRQRTKLCDENKQEGALIFLNFLHGAMLTFCMTVHLFHNLLCIYYYVMTTIGPQLMAQQSHRD